MGGCEDVGGRYREEGAPRQEKPGSNRDLIAQVEDRKWGATRRGKVDTGLREELIWMPSRGGKCRREVEAVSGALSRWTVAVRPGEMGGIIGCKDIENRCQRVKYGG